MNSSPRLESAPTQAPSDSDSSNPGFGQELRRLLRGLEHGELTIKVHEGKIVSIERLSKSRPKPFRRI
ncbi:YezD family protein [Schlesneria paludicola]|uniref:YezD family protein n=1 Tax=Schlesneria paludicola TaxID=360056 RepID=UPI00029B40FA|nr:YezD family protein [Schlesneria paludicola]